MTVATWCVTALLALVVGQIISEHGGVMAAKGIVVRNLTLAELRFIERSDVHELTKTFERDETIINATSYREGACTGLAYAAKLGHSRVVEFFASHGADVEARCHDNRFTPVMLATLCSLQKEMSHNLCPKHLKHDDEEDDAHSEVVRSLLSHGAAVDALEPTHDRNALHFAAMNGNENILEQLLLAGANGDALDSSGWSPLIYAVQKNDLESVRLLARVGADLNRADSMGTTALSHAAKFGNPKLVRALVKLGASCDVQDKFRKTPLDYAQAKGHSEVIKLLQDAISSDFHKTEL